MSGFVGFAKLRPGRVHLFCPGCKRKLSNVARGEYDPPQAALAHIWCERCSQGAKTDIGGYMDARGRWLSYDADTETWKAYAPPRVYPWPTPRAEGRKET